MKTKSLVLAGLALAAAVSCSKTAEDNLAVNGGEAYIAVKIAYSNTATRGTDEGYIYGNDDENALGNNPADFFFYMSDGTYFTHSAQKITTSAGASTTKDDNIEEIGNGVVVLKGLSSTKTPTYMAVVLNGSADLITNLKGKSINEAKAYATKDYANETSWTNFTMTSSAYKDAAKDAGYFCSRLTPSMFKTTEAAAKEEAAKAAGNVAVAYVERIAAKATLTTTLTPKTVGAETAYEFTTAPSIEVYNGASSYTTPTYYVKFGKWGLNSTTKESYTYKNIDPETWGNQFGSFVWDKSADFRSFWAKSVNYGVTTSSTNYYPKSYGNEANVYDATKNILNYISYNQCKAELGGNAYCRENTNTKAILNNNNFSSAVTSVLLTAQVLDAAGEPVNLLISDYRYFTEEGYYDYVLYKNSAAVPYVKTASSYQKAGKDCLEIVNDKDAYVHVQFKSGITYYTDNTGTVEKSLEDVNAYWTKERTLAEFYKDGMMYYNIPIEHLRNAGTFAAGTYDEADYGVVRNHWYNLSINSIANLGHPVYDPDEPIVPNDDDAKKYYVAAKINILSWKVVKQNVAL